ncbi:hypothetical protein JXJ21_02205 [candidate division KSB1 bacterium]|nr:hypothetical protein [candidate division KSB1 bacterium]
MPSPKVAFIDYLHTFISWRKQIIISFIIVCIIAAGISLLLPKAYKASATVYPASQEEAGLGLSSLLNNLPFAGLSLGNMSEEANMFLAIVYSRTIMESVVRQFDLQQRYGTETMEETIKALRDKVSIEINDEGTITIEAEAKTEFLPSEANEDQTKELAKNMADYIVSQSDEMNKQFRTEKAKNNRTFIENRYMQNISDLAKAEEEFNAFQKEFGAINLPIQTEAEITAAAELKAQIIAKEVEVGSLEKFVTKSHSTYQQAKIELMEMQRKYKELKSGTIGSQSKGAEKDLFLPFDDIPDIGLDYARKYREVVLQEKLLEFMLPQYEQAKIQEARDIPTILIIDHAAKPEKKSKPKRMLIVLLAGFLCILGFMIAAYISVNMDYMKQNDFKRYEQINSIFTQIKPKNWFK